MLKKNWLLTIFVALLLGLFCAAVWSQVLVNGKSSLSGKTTVSVPTASLVQLSGTLSSLTANNTSACSTQTYCTKSFTGLGTNASDISIETAIPDPAPGNISLIDIHKLLPAGTKVVAHFMGWFVTNATTGHIQTNYNSNDTNTVNAQMQDMIDRGMDGLIDDWYGQANATVDGTLQKVRDNLAAKCSGAQNCPMEFAAMVDQGMVKNACSGTTSGSCAVTSWENALCYLNATYFGSNAYLKMNPSTHAWAAGTDPVVYTFPPSAGWSSSDLSTVSTFAQNLSANCTGTGHGINNGSVLIVNEDTAGFSSPYNGAFSWVSPSTWSSANQFLIDGSNGTYHEDFYNNCGTHTGQICTGSAKKGFDDNNASWGLNRVVAQECGQTWMNTLRKATNFTGSNLTLQIPTWNDYEEGTEVETGIDNCYRVLPPTISGTTLTWAANTIDNAYAPVDANGAPTNGTADHWAIWYCDNAGNCNPAADNIPVATTSIDLSTLAIPQGTWQMYVQLIGQPMIINQLSSSYAVYGTISVSISPTSATVQTGNTQQFAATVTGSTNTAVSWEVDSSIGGNATVGTISTAGLYAAPSSIPSPSTVTVTAVSSADSSKTASAAVTIQAAVNAGPYSPTNQQPVTSEFFPNSLWTVKLPSDVMSHLATNSDAIVKHIFNNGDATDNGVGSFQILDVNKITVSEGGYYYSTCSDPVFRINSGAIPNVPNGPNSTSSNNPNGKYFHMPSGAKYDAVNDDQSLRVWDQCVDGSAAWSGPGTRIFSTYHFTNGTNSLRQLATSCACTTTTCADATAACQLGYPVDNYGEVSYPDTDTNAWGDGYLSDGSPVLAGLLREQEIMQGTVNHALHVDGQCVASDNAGQFPGIGFGPLACSPADTLRPVAGSHFFIDKVGRDPNGYDCDAQSSGKYVLPAWQRPVCHALQDYGGYFHDTYGPSSGVISGLNIQPIDDGINFFLLGENDPFFQTWITNPANQDCSSCTQSTSTGTSGWSYWNGPIVGGNYPFRVVLSGSAAVKTDLGFFQMPGLITGTGPAAHNDGLVHLHIANSCVAIGAAKLSSYGGVSACF